jgi:hypothetical protein
MLMSPSTQTCFGCVAACERCFVCAAVTDKGGQGDAGGESKVERGMKLVAEIEGGRPDGLVFHYEGDLAYEVNEMNSI